MQNSSGQAYGLTVLSPIRNGPDNGPSHADHVRSAVSRLGTGAASPLAEVPGTHMARLAVLDDVFYQSYPASADHLKSKYLFFSSNIDGPLETWLEALRTRIPDDVDRIWRHCVGYPGTQEAAAFRGYFERCQVNNAIFFADYPDATVADVLRALDTQRAFIDFVVRNQLAGPADLKEAFDEFMDELQSRPAPAPGSI
jgi:hypothetical protein